MPKPVNDSSTASSTFMRTSSNFTKLKEHVDVTRAEIVRRSENNRSKTDAWLIKESR